MVSVPAETRTHVDAVATLLRQGGLDVYVADPPRVPHDAVPFVVVWPDAGTVTAGSVGDHLSDLFVDFQTTSVGATAEQALWVHDKAARVLWGARPEVPGRYTLPIFAPESPQPVRRDDDLAVPLMFVAARWRLHTTP